METYKQAGLLVAVLFIAYSGTAHAIEKKLSTGPYSTTSFQNTKTFQNSGSTRTVEGHRKKSIPQLSNQELKDDIKPHNIMTALDETVDNIAKGDGCDHTGWATNTKTECIGYRQAKVTVETIKCRGGKVKAFSIQTYVTIDFNCTDGAPTGPGFGAIETQTPGGN